MVTPYPFAFRALTPLATPCARRVLMLQNDREFASALVASLLTAGIVTEQVETSAQALAALDTFQPEAALLDIALKDTDGVVLIQKLARARPSMPIVVLSQVNDEAQILAALRAGAKGYVFRSELGDRVAALIEEALRGGSPLSRSVTRLLLRTCSEGGSSAEPAPDLTRREKGVLAMLSQGKSYAEVGAELGVSENTVRSHVRSLYDKLGVSSKTGAVMAALRLGLVRVP